MTVAIRSTTAANSGTSDLAGNAGIVVNVPSGTQNGDVLYLVIQLTSSTGTIDTLTGWTVVEAQFASVGIASAKMMAWRRVASGEPASYTITWGAAGNTGRAAAIMVALTGVNNGTPQQDKANSTGSGSASSVAIPSVTPSTATMILGFAGAYTATTAPSGIVTWTPDGAMTEAADTSSANTTKSNASLELSYQSVSSGATGTRTSTGTLSNLSTCAVMVAVNPTAGFAHTMIVG